MLSLHAHQKNSVSLYKRKFFNFIKVKEIQKIGRNSICYKDTYFDVPIRKATEARYKSLICDNMACEILMISI